MITPHQGPITGDEIAACAVTTAKINTSAVTTAKIAACDVTTTLINDSAVTTGKINTSAVTTAKIAACDVTTTLINDSAVTTGKINTSAITTEKIAASDITTTLINASAVTAAKLKASALDYIKYHGVVSDAALSAAGQYSLATAGFTPEGVIAVPLAHTSIVFQGLATIPATSKATLSFRTLTATGFMKATSNTITFYYEYMRP